MKQIALSIEQMKALQELGLDTSDASLIWISSGTRKDLEFNCEFFDTKPGNIFKVCNTYTLQDMLDKLQYIPVYIYRSDAAPIWIIEAVHYNKCFGGENLLDITYKMLCWCIENKIELNKL